MAENQNDATQKPIRTYQSDVEQILKEGEGSFAKIAIAENNKRIYSSIGNEEGAPDAPSNSKIIIFISIGLIIIGIIIFLSIYFFRTEDKPVIITPEIKSIIDADATITVDINKISRTKILEKIIAERENRNIKLSSIISLKLIEGEVDKTPQIVTNELLKRLESRAPDELIRSLDDNFMFGIHALNKNQPFLIFKVNYYQNAFAGMLSWERNMIEDIGSIFIEKTPEPEIVSSEQILKNNLGFEDAVVKNRDARVLKDSEGKINFLYSFPDKNTLIITTNAETLEQVAKRLLAGKLVQ